MSSRRESEFARLEQLLREAGASRAGAKACRTRTKTCGGRAAKSNRSRREGRIGAKTCRGSRRACRTATKACGRRAAKSTRSGVSRSDRGNEDKTHKFRRIHTCLPYTPLEATSYPDRQESQHTGLHHQPQGQALPDPGETLDGLSDSAATTIRKSIRIHPSRYTRIRRVPLARRMSLRILKHQRSQEFV
jgi:hypothetical protein